MDLQDRVVVITGASSGFGEAIARSCSRAGARVILVARSAAKLEQLAAELGGPSRAAAIAADVTSDSDVARMAAEAIQHFGHVDVLVNNAGFGILDAFVDAKLTDLQEMMDVNVYGAVRCTQALLPHMCARRSGQIVMMASVGGLLGFRNMAFYNATKFALVGMFQAMAVELEGSGVRCAIICPGVAHTTFMQRADIRKFSRATRLVPWLTAEQVGEATMRMIARRTHGRVIIPWQARPLVALGSLLPSLGRFVLRLIG